MHWPTRTRYLTIIAPRNQALDDEQSRAARRREGPVRLEPEHQSDRFHHASNRPD